MPVLDGGPRRSALRSNRILPASPATSVIASGSSQLKLHNTQHLPTIDLSRTIWASALSPRWRTRLVQFMMRRYMTVATLHRLGTVVFFLTLVLPPSNERYAVIALVCLPILALSLTLMFLSLDVVRLLAREHEFWFISCINALNWGSLAYMLGDERSLVVVPTWWGIQIVILLDANYRTYMTAVRSIVMAIPAVLSVAVLCVLDLVHDPRHREITVHKQQLSIPNLLVFTATTITIFMGRNVILKIRRTHASFPGFNVIPCVVLRARLRCSLASAPSRRSVTSIEGAEAMRRAYRAPNLQRLLLSRLSLSRLEATRTVLPSSEETLSQGPLPWLVLVPMYMFGFIGFVTLLAGTARVILMGPSYPVDVWLSGVSFVTTSIFCGTLAFHFNRDILRTLLLTFDYVFATFQLLMIGICLMILVAWALAPTVLIVTAFIWFQWLLSLDALTPPFKKMFRFRRRVGLPIIIVFLSAMTWMLVLIAFHRSSSVSTPDTDLVLLSFQVSASRSFEMTTVELLVGRIVTLLGWLGTRLIVEFATLDEDDLMFVRGRLLYLSPYETFPPSRQTLASRSTAHGKSDRSLPSDLSSPVYTGLSLEVSEHSRRSRGAQADDTGVDVHNGES